MNQVDPVTLAVIQNGLQQVCNEMDLAFVRAAFSPVIAEGLDRSDGIYACGTGELIAQGELGLPIFVGTMQFSTKCVIDRAREINEGDIFILNDPYLGGTHLMDVKFVKPFFYRGRHFAWLSNTGHWPDTGGMVPGGFSAHATEVEQEGLRLPPVKLFKRGQIDEEILSIIFSNIRVADQRIGDVKAQAAALAIGERRLTTLLDRYGEDVVSAAIAQLKDRATRQMRAKIHTIPDGSYESTTIVDSDGVVNEPLEIHLKIVKDGDDLTFDFTGSSAPCRGPMNSVLATTKSAVYLAIKHIFPEVPINAGTFVPLHIIDPVGTFLDARYPSPVSGCAAEVSQRIAEAVFLALARALPDRAFGAPAGTSGNLAIGGRDPKTGQNYVMYIVTGGGYGGSSAQDGISNGCSTIGISKTPPIEILEQRFPVLFDEFAIAEGSGGAGRHRGGFGVRYKVSLRRGEARASFVMDHGRVGPPGVFGGDSGMPNDIEIIQNGKPSKPTHLSKDQDVVLHEGDAIHVHTPGGGGFGAPAGRSLELIKRDAMREYYDKETLKNLYGVSADELSQPQTPPRQRAG
jgi:N-methylhydantoinase B